MDVEQYDKYGDIIKPKPKPVLYERGMTTEQQHRIHETKDLFDSECYLCRKAAAKKRKSYWGDDA